MDSNEYEKLINDLSKETEPEAFIKRLTLNVRRELNIEEDIAVKELITILKRQGNDFVVKVTKDSW